MHWSGAGMRPATGENLMATLYIYISIYIRPIYIDGWNGASLVARCQSKRIKNDSQPDFGVRMIKKGRKKTKSWQRLNNEKYKIYLKRFGLNTLVPEVFLDFSSRKRSTASREAATTSPLAMKKMPDAFSIYFACFQIPPFETMILYSFWAIYYIM